MPNSSAKFVLTVIANCADGKEYLAFPSIAYIAEATSQDPKTVKVNLKRLKDWGFIEDSGKRCGGTGQVIVYRINVGKTGLVKEVQKRTTSKNGPGPKTAAKEPKNGVKEVQKRQVTGPKTDPVNVSKRNEPSRTVISSSPTTSPPAARGTRLPKDWVLTKALGVWAAGEQPTWTPEHIRKVAAAFKDHWIAQPGLKGRKTDWEATWRNWVRNGKPLGGAVGVSAAAVSGNWWEGDAGINAKGGELGVERGKDEPTPLYLLRVAKVAGRGPWIDHILRHAKTGGARWYEQVVATLGDGLLPTDF
nr:helix-turn-helix domain-containing protein [Paraburkholderia fungorum]